MEHWIVGISSGFGRRRQSSINSGRETKGLKVDTHEMTLVRRLMEVRSPGTNSVASTKGSIGVVSASCETDGSRERGSCCAETIW